MAKCMLAPGDQFSGPCEGETAGHKVEYSHPRQRSRTQIETLCDAHAKYMGAK